jgi:2-keto-4-pentenoate hydratase/2-oxohepta-3-ene-1,7-dioic acid hydratase in catechol pathway
MKYVTFEHHGREQVGALDMTANRIYPLDLDGMIAVISRQAVTVPERHSGGDSFCPMGPWVVTADEVDASSLSIRCWVNEELRQNGSTRALIFDGPTLIETISTGIILYPGDITDTGTPKGVGIGFNPPRYIRPGDTVRISIDGLGTLVNRVGGIGAEKSARVASA